ncbi:hypothetical protein Pelo_3897 [Pelomyxa schiedti]|nr:hypothetical protein Pelo_3897 [Pelomyxa schiedti]
MVYSEPWKVETLYGTGGRKITNLGQFIQAIGLGYAAALTHSLLLFPLGKNLVATFITIKLLGNIIQPLSGICCMAQLLASHKLNIEEPPPISQINMDECDCFLRVIMDVHSILWMLDDSPGVPFKIADTFDAPLFLHLIAAIHYPPAFPDAALWHAINLAKDIIQLSKVDVDALHSFMCTPQSPTVQIPPPAVPYKEPLIQIPPAPQTDVIFIDASSTQNSFIRELLQRRREITAVQQATLELNSQTAALEKALTVLQDKEKHKRVVRFLISMYSSIS